MKPEIVLLASDKKRKDVLLAQDWEYLRDALAAKQEDEGENILAAPSVSILERGKGIIKKSLGFLVVEDEIENLADILMALGRLYKNEDSAEFLRYERIVGVCTSADDFAAFMDASSAGPKVMTLDFQLRTNVDSRQAIAETSGLYSRCKALRGWESTCVLGLSNHARDLRYVREFVQNMHAYSDSVLEKKPRLMRVLDSILLDTLIKQKVVHEKSLSPTFCTSPATGKDLKSQTCSSLYQGIIARAKQCAETDEPVLLTGKTGVGKSYFAQNHIHALSKRADEPFVVVDCSTLTKDLIDNQLFGHVAGAFCGAQKKRPGLVEQANGGTLFFDEIGDLPVEIQTKLLRVVQEKKYRKLGEVEEREIDVRLIAATNKDLRTEMERGAFRSDLFYRIQTFCLRIPSLFERKEDIPGIARAIAESFPTTTAKNVSFTEDAYEAFIGYALPGNYRELEAYIKRLVVFAKAGDVIGKDQVVALVESGTIDVSQWDDAEPVARDVPSSPANTPPGGATPCAEVDKELYSADTADILDRINQGMGQGKERGELSKEILGGHRAYISQWMQNIPVLKTMLSVPDCARRWSHILADASYKKNIFSPNKKAKAALLEKYADRIPE